MKMKNIFKKTMENVNFLTESEQKDLKNLRNENINDSELQPFITFLKKNGEKFSLNSRENRISVHRIAKEFFVKKVMYKPDYERITSAVSAFKYDHQFDDLVSKTVPGISPEINKFTIYASTLTVERLHVQIQDYLWRHLDTSLDFYFNYLDFIADTNFDLSIYSIDHLKNDLKSNTIAIHNAFDGVFNTICKSMKPQGDTTEYNAYNLFVESVSKSLNDEQKALIKDDFLGNFKFYLDNSKPDLIENKNADFRKFVKHTYLIPSR